MSTQDLGFVHRYFPGESGVTLLLLHGTGGDENDLVPLGRELAPGAGILSPRGKVSEYGAARFSGVSPRASSTTRTSSSAPTSSQGLSGRRRRSTGSTPRGSWR